MKRYRYFLDSNLLADDPIGWDAIKPKIHFVAELNARLLKIEAELSFYGDGFAYLLSQYDTEGHCGLVNVEIQELNNDLQTYRLIHTGYIFISDIQIYRKEMLIKTQVEDNSFYARINNNKSIETFPWATLSKNNITITETAASNIKFIHPDCATTNALSLTFGYYRVFDLFRYITDFMGDARIDFASTLFDIGGDFEGLIVTCGFAIRLATGGLQEDPFKQNFKKLSFIKLFTEINKKIHLGMRIELTGGRPVLRIERDSYFRQTTTMHTCSNIDRVTESINKQKLYSNIKLGSTVLNDAQSLSFNEDLTFLGFKEEDFIILGECNIDRTLDLVSEFVISSNVIQDCLVNGAVSYDSNFFLLMTEPLYGFYTQKTGNVFGDPTPCQYNLDLTNVAVTQNWLDGIPNSMAQYVASPVDLFKTQTTFDRLLNDYSQSSNTVVPIQYNDDNSTGFFDINGDYDAVTNFDFTSPADGSYSFKVYSSLYARQAFIFAPVAVSMNVNVRVKVYDAGGLSGGNLISSNEFQFDFTSANQTTYSHFTWFTPAIYMQNTYRAVVEMTAIQNDFLNAPVRVRTLLLHGSYWQCIGSQQGGIVQGIDPADYPVILHEFEQDLTSDEFDAINADSRGLVDCTTHRGYRFQAWIEELEFDRAKGKAKFKLYSTKNLNG